MNNQSASHSAPAQEQDWPSQTYGWYVTLVLLLGFTFSFVDRQVLNLLVDPIREDLQISDTQISFLQGLAFVLTYVALSVPVGRLVDKFNRVRIMIGGVLVWSATTICCGLSQNYTQLLASRLGVGAGEASLSPAAWSVLADYFHPDKLARPISVYLMGPYIGAGIAMIAGAEVLDWTADAGQLSLPLIGEVAPWQFTFIAVGLPGILIAALIATIREPKRRGRVATRVNQTNKDTTTLAVPSWAEVWAYMKANRRIYISLHLGVPFIVVMLYGLQSWVPTLLVRVFDWELSQAGRIYGVVALIAGSSGVLTGPFVARWLAARGRTDAPLWVAIYGATVATAAIACIPLQTAGDTALVFVFIASFHVTLPLALITTMMQEVTPNAMRGVVNGMYVVTANILGLALGPTLVALATDYLFADPTAVAKSLGLVALCVGPVAVLLLNLGRVPYAQRQLESTPT